MSIEVSRIYNEDCMETLSRVEDQEIDLSITSPPYNMNLRIRKGEYCSRQITKEFSNKYEGFTDNMPIDDFYSHHFNRLGMLIEKSKLVFYNISIVTGSKRAFFKMIGSFHDYLKDIIIWDKGYGEPAMQTGILNRQSELILVFEKSNAISRQFKDAPFKRGTLSDLWTIPKERSKVKGHAAVFPEVLIENILVNFSQEGDIVYDPYMGTGTTAVVAERLNRRWFGSEINSEFCKAANQRIKVL